MVAISLLRLRKPTTAPYGNHLVSVCHRQRSGSIEITREFSTAQRGVFRMAWELPDTRSPPRILLRLGVTLVFALRFHKPGNRAEYDLPKIQSARSQQRAAL